MSKKAAADWTTATVEELRAGILELDAKIASADAAKAELLSSRGEYVLSGGDSAERGRAQYAAEETIAGLVDAREILQKHLDKAEAEAQRSEAERGLEAERAMVPQLEAAYLRVDSLLDEMWDALDDIPRIILNMRAAANTALMLDYPQQAFVEPLVVRKLAALKCEASPIAPYERGHLFDADPLEIKARRVAVMLRLRMISRDRANLTMPNLHLHRVEMERQGIEDAETRRLSILAAKQSAAA